MNPRRPHMAPQKQRSNHCAARRGVVAAPPAKSVILSPRVALVAVLTLAVAFRVSLAASTTINEADGAVLKECQDAWGVTMEGWKAGSDCNIAGSTLDCSSEGKITNVNVRNKNLTGSIPTSLGNLAQLTSLDLSRNNLTGRIPESISKLKLLGYINLAYNQLSGPIPTGIGELTVLTGVKLRGNQLNGSIPDSLCKCTKLASLLLSINRLTGRLPESIGKLTRLKVLWAHNNSLTGEIPKSLSQLARLHDLNLGSNNFTGTFPAAVLALTTVNSLSLNSINLSGSIPNDITALQELKWLNLNDNRLEGTIPSTLYKITSLVKLQLASNKLQGSIPQSIERLQDLNLLNLGNNGLTGNLPTNFHRLKLLQEMQLSNNRLDGAIPAAIAACTALNTLKLNGNQLSGSIPHAIGRLIQLTELDLANNSLSGSIPSTLKNLTKLKMLALAANGFTGQLPPDLGNLKLLEALLVNNTQLSGIIPPQLDSLEMLQILATGNTSLECPTQNACYTRLSNSSKFCQKCPQYCTACLTGSATVGRTVWIAVGVSLAVLLLVGGLVACLLLRRLKALKRGTGHTVSARVQSVEAFAEYSLSEVKRATNNWAAENRLGAGGFGDVYKGVNPRDGVTKWAVKRSRIVTPDFDSEVKQMATKHHPNLVRLLGYCDEGDKEQQEQILIYEFVANGDLDRWIGPNTSTRLTLCQRLDILIGVARGFEYMHSFKTIHRDIKPANILITDSMQAKIADFGLVKQDDGPGQLSATRVMGTPGYVDPAYLLSQKATTATDVYSFGVLILVMLTGRDVVASVNKKFTYLRDLAKQAISSNNASSIRDPCLPNSASIPDRLLLLVANTAVRCTDQRTALRPSMGEVATDLQAVLKELGGGEEERAKADSAVLVDKEIEAMRIELQGNDDVLDEELGAVMRSMATLNGSGRGFPEDGHVGAGFFTGGDGGGSVSDGGGSTGGGGDDAGSAAAAGPPAPAGASTGAGGAAAVAAVAVGTAVAVTAAVVAGTRRQEQQDAAATTGGIEEARVTIHEPGTSYTPFEVTDAAPAAATTTGKATEQHEYPPPPSEEIVFSPKPAAPFSAPQSGASGVTGAHPLQAATPADSPEVSLSVEAAISPETGGLVPYPNVGLVVLSPPPLTRQPELEPAPAPTPEFEVEPELVPLDSSRDVAIAIPADGESVEGWKYASASAVAAASAAAAAIGAESQHAAAPAAGYAAPATSAVSGYTAVGVTVSEDSDFECSEFHAPAPLSNPSLVSHSPPAPTAPLAPTPPPAPTCPPAPSSPVRPPSPPLVSQQQQFEPKGAPSDVLASPPLFPSELSFSLESSEQLQAGAEPSEVSGSRPILYQSGPGPSRPYTDDDDDDGVAIKSIVPSDKTSKSTQRSG